jgi:hypothetical protein
MGKKSDKKAGDEAPAKKKKRKAEATEPEPLMLAVQRCPPASRLSFEWVVGNGIGKHAVRDALQAYERAWPARLERADRVARSAEAQRCEKGCTAGRVSVFGPITGAQHWRIDSDIDPMTATTWNWVGYITVCDCDA